VSGLDSRGVRERGLAQDKDQDKDVESGD